MAEEQLRRGELQLHPQGLDVRASDQVNGAYGSRLGPPGTTASTRSASWRSATFGRRSPGLAHLPTPSGIRPIPLDPTPCYLWSLVWREGTGTRSLGGCSSTPSRPDGRRVAGLRPPAPLLPNTDLAELPATSGEARLGGRGDAMPYRRPCPPQFGLGFCGSAASAASIASCLRGTPPRRVRLSAARRQAPQVLPWRATSAIPSAGQWPARVPGQRHGHLPGSEVW